MDDDELGALHGPHAALLALLDDVVVDGDAAALQAASELVGSIARLSVELRLRADRLAGRLLAVHGDVGGAGVSPGRAIRRALGVDRSASHRLRRFASEVSEAELERIIDQVWDGSEWPASWTAASCINPPPSTCTGD